MNNTKYLASNYLKNHLDFHKNCKRLSVFHLSTS